MRRTRASRAGRACTRFHLRFASMLAWVDDADLVPSARPRRRRPNGSGAASTGQTALPGSMSTVVGMSRARAKAQDSSGQRRALRSSHAASRAGGVREPPSIAAESSGIHQPCQVSRPSSAELPLSACRLGAGSVTRVRAELRRPRSRSSALPDGSDGLSSRGIFIDQVHEQGWAATSSVGLSAAARRRVRSRSVTAKVTMSIFSSMTGRSLSFRDPAKVDLHFKERPADTDGDAARPPEVRLRRSRRDRLHARPATSLTRTFAGHADRGRRDVKLETIPEIIDQDRSIIGGSEARARASSNRSRCSIASLRDSCGA